MTYLGLRYVISTSLNPPSPTSCTAARPRPSASVTKGCSSASTSAGTIGALTAVAASSPYRQPAGIAILLVCSSALYLQLMLLCRLPDDCAEYLGASRACCKDLQAQAASVAERESGVKSKLCRAAPSQPCQLKLGAHAAGSTQQPATLDCAVKAAHCSPHATHDKHRLLALCASANAAKRSTHRTGSNARASAACTLLTLRAPMTASAISTATPSCASVVEAPRWGVHTTSERLTRGLSVGGSFSNTSSAACPQRMSKCQIPSTCFFKAPCSEWMPAIAAPEQFVPPWHDS